MLASLNPRGAFSPGRPQASTTFPKIRGESQSFRLHCKGGGGVERGGDPCGRPGGCNVSGREPPHLRDPRRSSYEHNINPASV